jgi:hypothetical protein
MKITAIKHTEGENYKNSILKYPSLQSGYTAIESWISTPVHARKPKMSREGRDDTTAEVSLVDVSCEASLILS